MQSDFLGRNTFLQGGVLCLSGKIKGPLTSGRATHSPRQRSPASGLWGLFCKSRASAWLPWRLLLPENSLVLNGALRESRPPFQSRLHLPSGRRESGSLDSPKSWRHFFSRKHELAYGTLSSIGPGSTHRAPGSCTLRFPGATPHGPRAHQKSLALHTSWGRPQGNPAVCPPGSPGPALSRIHQPAPLFCSIRLSRKNKDNLLLRSTY